MELTATVAAPPKRAFQIARSAASTVPLPCSPASARAREIGFWGALVAGPILAGVLLAQPFLVMLYAKNRPDLPAKFHLLELAIHLPMTVVCGTGSSGD